MFFIVSVLCCSSLAFGGVKKTKLGDPLPGLTAEQLAEFEEGVDEFSDVETAEDGLGPVFNARSCAECHAQPVVGGSSPNLVLARETRFARILNGSFDPMEEFGGPVIQRQAIHERDCSMEPEEVPAEATLVSQRTTTPLFGAGLMEAIPASVILAQADPGDDDHDGISGRANIVFNPETGKNEVGRFGWKAHVSTLHRFAGDAYLNEMGITNPSFPKENKPQGHDIPDACDAVSEEDGSTEDEGGVAVTAFADFMALLAPPAPRTLNKQAERGRITFVAIGCAKCHVPALSTSSNTVAALRFKQVNLFSDLLLHDMGPELEDGMEMGSAMGDEWRTAPLWGLSRRRFFLHDGRTSNLEDAILAHGGEGTNVRERFKQLERAEQRALIRFLKSL